MTKIFVDSDVILDLLEERAPFHSEAELFFDAGERALFELYSSSVVFTNVYYVLKFFYKMKNPKPLLLRLREYVRLLGVDEDAIDQALHSSFKDFEDAVQYYTALEADMDFIVTRNLKDYKNSEIPVVLPQEINRLFYEPEVCR